MAEDDLEGYMAGLTGLGGNPSPPGWSVDNSWAPQPQQPAQITVNQQPPTGAGSAYAQQGGGPPPPAAPPPPPTSGLGSWFGLLGGGAAAPAPRPGTQPGWQQGAVGLGLGLLSGNPFNKWGRAMEGYQRGAAADVARQQLANQYAYQQQQLGISGGHLDVARQQLALQRDIAFKPMVQFQRNEDTGEWEALQYDPIKQTFKLMPVPQADKLANQEGVRATMTIGGSVLTCPANVNCREWRKDMAKYNAQYEADKATGKIGPQQLFNQWLTQKLSGPQTAAVSRPPGVPANATRQKFSTTGEIRWKVKKPGGGYDYYDKNGKPVAE